MDTMKDKLIADKLATLNELPDGYSPNLDNKWALIEAGLKKPASKKTGLIWLTGIAASLVIGGLMGYLFFGTGSALPVKNQTQAIVVSPLPVYDAPLIKSQVEPKQKKLSLSRPAKEELPVLAIPSLGENSTVNEAVNEPAPDTLVAASLVPAVEKVNSLKRKKTRYVQIDFFDSVKSADVSSQLYAKSFHFKVFQSTGNPPQNPAEVGVGASTLRVKL